MKQNKNIERKQKIHTKDLQNIADLRLICS